MIVVKTWITKNFNERAKHGMKFETRKWRGCYLFGFIPLFIQNYETVYE